ncbi:hypothetical protein PR003_g29284 [Phytophthora rubi]|uniref:Uncharacterized protein n=1 Tax=Phytophthora rubi TaxID=129364 RepID=A0A6A4BM51_9STRA|nr:hypothetical protein PR003_g29284 [Phytophthora rubi]
MQDVTVAADLHKLVQHVTHRVADQKDLIMQQKQCIFGEHNVEMLKTSENWYEYVNDHATGHSTKDMKILEVGRHERGDDLKESFSRLQKDDLSDIKSGVEKLTVSQKFAKKKVEKRGIWAGLGRAQHLKPYEKGDGHDDRADPQPAAAACVRALVDSYKHHRSGCEKPILPREPELEAAKKLIKYCNYFDRKDKLNADLAVHDACI